MIARASGRESVVFGTVLFGRMHAGEGADRAMGLFIDTLPLRLDLDATSIEQSIQRTHTRLAELLRHEHATSHGSALQRGHRSRTAVQRPAQLPTQHHAICC